MAQYDESTTRAMMVEIERDEYEAIAGPDMSGNVFRDGDVVRELSEAHWKYDSPFQFNVRLKNDMDVSGGKPSDEEEAFYREVGEAISNQFNQQVETVMEEVDQYDTMEEKRDAILNLDPNDLFDRKS